MVIKDLKFFIGNIITVSQKLTNKKMFENYKDFVTIKRLTLDLAYWSWIGVP